MRVDRIFAPALRQVVAAVDVDELADDVSVARNTMTSAMSSGSASRPVGVRRASSASYFFTGKTYLVWAASRGQTTCGFCSRIWIRAVEALALSPVSLKTIGPADTMMGSGKRVFL